jgi:aspartate dehydrogenase
MLNLALVGCGAIGTSVLELLHGDPDVRVCAIVTRPGSLAAVQVLATRWAPQAQVVASLDAATDCARVDLLLECAGHSAITAHVLPALEHGIPCLIASIGSISLDSMLLKIEKSAQHGNTQVQLLSGAVGGIDALAAAKIGGLDSVVYTGRKPPLAWKGTPAQDVCDLDALTTAHCIFDGNATQAAQLYPKNANVAATLALAGLGLERTRVQLFADPGVRENVHHVAARGAFGEFELTVRGKPLAANPKTSALTVYSAVRGVLNRARALIV